MRVIYLSFVIALLMVVISVLDEVMKNTSHQTARNVFLKYALPSIDIFIVLVSRFIILAIASTMLFTLAFLLNLTFHNFDVAHALAMLISGSQNNLALTSNGQAVLEICFWLSVLGFGLSYLLSIYFQIQKRQGALKRSSL